jgi:hypothetical protein
MTTMMNKSVICNLTLPGNTQEKSDRLTTGISAFFILELLQRRFQDGLWAETAEYLERFNLGCVLLK